MSETAVSIRLMEISDIEWVKNLKLQTPELHADPHDPICESSEEWEDLIDDPDCVVLVAELMGARAGFSYGLKTFIEEPKEGAIADLVIEPSFRNLGIGSTLLVETLRELQKRGINDIEALVRLNNHAGLAFLERNGFTIGDRTLDTPFRLCLMELTPNFN